MTASVPKTWISLDLPAGALTPLPGGTTDFHITLVFLGPDPEEKEFRKACVVAARAAASMPCLLTVTLAGISCFAPSESSGKRPVFVPVLPENEYLYQLHYALAYLSVSEHLGWVPHVTVAFLDPAEPLPPPLWPVQVILSELSVHRGDQVATFPLGMNRNDIHPRRCDRCGKVPAAFVNTPEGEVVCSECLVRAFR